MKPKYLTLGDLQKIYERTGAPSLHFGAHFGNIRECEYKKVLRTYCETIAENIANGNGLVLYGPFSSGKSALAAICIKSAIFVGQIGYWLRYMDLTAGKIEAIPFDAESTVYERCLLVPLLVVDELIVRKSAQYSEILLEEVVRHRLDDTLSTIITTNHTLAELSERHPALCAALSEKVTFVEVKGYDFRKKRVASELPRTGEAKPSDKRTDGTTKMGW